MGTEWEQNGNENEKRMGMGTRKERKWEKNRNGMRMGMRLGIRCHR